MPHSPEPSQGFTLLSLLYPVNTTASSYSWKSPFVVYFTMLSIARLYCLKY
jgi:hypothetical protein